MSQTGQIAVSYPGDDLTLFFNTSDLPSAINEVNNKPDGAQITLYAGDYSADSSAIDNLSQNRWMVLLPGAKVDYNAFSSSKVPQISDLDQLSVLDDILDPLDEFLDPDPSLGDGRIAYYDAVDDKMRYTDLLLVDTDNQKVDIQDLEIDQDINFETESESLLTKLDQLEGLLPSAPALDSKSGTTGVEGKLSFGSSNNISGVNNAPNTDFQEVFGTSGTKQGIIGTGDGPLNGILNDDVVSNSKHDADVFGQADIGKLELVINGTVFSSATIDLSNLNSQNTIASGTGLSVSQATNVTFSDGSTFSDGYQRSGTWSVSESQLQSGYNTIKVQHFDESNNLITETDALEYVYDDETSTIAFSNTGIFGPLNKTGDKFLSGIEYDLNATAYVEGTVDNVYLYTYSNSPSGISFPVNDGYNISPISIPDGNSETDDINISEQVSSEDLLFSAGFEGNIQVEDTVEPSETSSTFSNFEFLIDDYPNNNTDLDQHFDGEGYRIKSDTSTFTGDFNSDLAGNWNSQKSIQDSGDPGYNDGLQIEINPTETGHRLNYPTFDYSSIIDGPPGNSDRDYSGSNTTGFRSFFGYWRNSTSDQNFTIHIYGSGTLIDDGTTFTAGSDEIKIAFRLPSETGWLDITEDFVPGAYGNVSDGSAYGNAVDGGHNSSLGADFDLSGGATVGITSGTKTTADSFDKIYYRIVVPENWTGYLSRIRIDW